MVFVKENWHITYKQP